MFKHTFLWVVLFTAVAIGVAVLIPSDPKKYDESLLPWVIKVNDKNQSTVFGITLGQSTLLDAQKSLHAEGEISLFETKDGEYSVEVFIDSIYLNTLKANLYLTLEVSQQTAKEMLGRSVNVSRAKDQSNKVKLADADLKAMSLVPVRHIIYIPRANLDAELIERRFGVPTQKLKESEVVEHWLYPNKGLDIALNSEGREIFQYVLPMNFSQIVDPLLQASQAPSLRP
ncbi:MAG: hypothetical protein ISR69_05080 [Gammaproteobacteria bacterium]|nr:hypothetical protein [Gammaproteobacteria bacterium]